MRFLKLFLIILLCNIAFARSDKFSDITLPQAYFLNIYMDTCDEKCMRNLIDKKLVFSFLSIYNEGFSDKYIEESYFIYGRALGIFPVEKVEEKLLGKTRLAILVPQKVIGRYASTTVNTAFSYMLTQSNEFEISVFNSNDEEEESIINALEKIRKDGFTCVIAPVTQNGASVLLDYSTGLHVFIPTLHSSIFSYVPSNVVFGGIDYRDQVKKLQQFTNENITIFSDGSKLADNINSYIKEDNKVAIEEVFSGSNMDFKKFFKNNNINQTSVFYNTPLITTSLISSQIRAYKNEPFVQLSTQINYLPTLLTLTQFADRKNMYLANSINNSNPTFESISAVFEQNVNYDWVSYATAIGVEYLATNFFESKFEKIFNEDISNSQVIYNTNIYKAGYYKFIKQNIQDESLNVSDELQYENFEDSQDTNNDSEQYPTLRNLFAD